MSWLMAVRVSLLSSCAAPAAAAACFLSRKHADEEYEG